MHKWIVGAAATAVVVLALAACGGSDNGKSGGGGRTSLTIYSSLPLQGESRAQSESVVNGEKLALEEAGGQVGKFKITYKSLDDATAAAGKWEPGQTSADARKAAQDPSTIVYLGEFNSGASAISLPITNEAGILQISPSNTYVGLTRAEGADKGEPDKYYPSAKRSSTRSSRSRTATRSSASTRSTRTATPRCPTTAPTASRAASWCSTRSSRRRAPPDHDLTTGPAA